MKAFIICRDRLAYAVQCLDALTSAKGIDDIHVIDHDSTYPPMQRWLAALGGSTQRWGIEGGRVHVHWRPNAHPRDLWGVNGALATVVRPDERFIVTDCDVIPDPDCPTDWVATLGAVLDRWPGVEKAGLSLRVDDLPEHYAHRAEVIDWERNYRRVPVTVDTVIRPVRCHLASIDTTLAMYRGLGPFRLDPAVRTAAPYQARHLSWYEDSANPDEEIRWYAERAKHGHWRAPADFQDDHGLGGS